jgi:hypothetical protein
MDVLYHDELSQEEREYLVSQRGPLAYRLVAEQLARTARGEPARIHPLHELAGYLRSAGDQPESLKTIDRFGGELDFGACFARFLAPVAAVPGSTPQMREFGAEPRRFGAADYLSATADHRIALRGEKPAVARWDDHLVQGVAEILMMDLAANMDSERVPD